MSRSRRSRVHLVTQARTPKSQDISYRERRYLIMMAVRVACFILAIVMVSNGAGWLAAFPAVGAIVIPYFAVVFANGGREPNDTRGFREYEPNLPEPHPSPSRPDRLHLREVVIVPRPAGPAEPPAGEPGQTGAAAAGEGEPAPAGATPAPAGPISTAGHTEPIEPAHPADPHIRAAWAGQGSETADPARPAGPGRQV